MSGLKRQLKTLCPRAASSHCLTAASPQTSKCPKTTQASKCPKATRTQASKCRKASPPQAGKCPKATPSQASKCRKATPPQASKCRKATPPQASNKKIRGQVPCNQLPSSALQVWTGRLKTKMLAPRSRNQNAISSQQPQHTVAAAHGKSPAATPTLTKAEAPVLAIVPAVPKCQHEHERTQQQTAAKSCGPPPPTGKALQLQAPPVDSHAHVKSAAATPTPTKAKDSHARQEPPPPAAVIQKRLARIMEPNAKGIFKVSESIRQQWHTGDKQGIYKMFASVGYNPDRV